MNNIICFEKEDLVKSFEYVLDILHRSNTLIEAEKEITKYINFTKEHILNE